MKKLLILSLGAVICLSAGAAAAQNCATPPSCESLGYTKSAADCSGLVSLKCPFDNSKLYCTTCADMGFTQKVLDCYNENVGKAMYVKYDSCPYDIKQVRCHPCFASSRVELGAGDFCINSTSEYPEYIGIFGWVNIGCAPCEAKFSCSSGLVFDPECNCCNYPK